MANFYSYVEVDMKSFTLFSETVVYASYSYIKVVDSSYPGYSAWYWGDFRYDEDDNVYGTLTRYQLNYGSFVRAKLSDVELNANKVMNWIESGNYLAVAKVAFSGNDIITGSNYGDRLIGFSGNDKITGGWGKDILTGGRGADSFIFRSVSESAASVKAADVITDFERGKDKIDLSAIDAFSGTSANDTFIWRGSAGFSGASQGEVRYKKFDMPGTAKDYTMVFINDDRYTDLDMAIRLTGLHELTQSDFIL